MTVATQKTSLIRFGYKFVFGNGEQTEFNVNLDPETLEFIPEREMKKPEWAKLKFSQCENCPLSDDVEYCPVAVNLSRVVDTFREKDSFEKTTISVETPERTYVRETSLQKGLSSIIGMLMTTSNCPILDKLRPNTRFHLPFATSLETFYRTVSMYLTAQFFEMREGRTPDWELKHLLEIYKQVAVVNKGFSRRLTNASTKDANVNALIILHSFGDGISYFIENGLEEIKNMFTVYSRSPKE